MASLVRLVAQPVAHTAEVVFLLLFSAPQEQDEPICAPATLETGDGHTIDLGALCSPATSTWRQQRQIELARHRYTNAGQATATLRWGDTLVTAPAGAPAAAPAAQPSPSVTLFSATPQPGDVYTVKVKLAIDNLDHTHQVRIDGGAGNVQWLAGSAVTQEQTCTLTYFKPGAYHVGVDLVDQDGFWLATLAEAQVEIADPEAKAAPADVATPAIVEDAGTEELTAPLEAAAALPPWLPFRYARPLWAWTRTYTRPGGPVSRSLALGTYLAIRQEVLANGALWYQTGSYDWIPASSVALMTPSELRGVVLGSVAPPPPPPPPPARRGVVTATVLNVRARPGVSADNPPIASLRRGQQVEIYEEASADGAIWFRIGVGRWVHSGWIQIITTASAAQDPATAAPSPLAGEVEPVTASEATMTLPVGWVVVSSLNVRGTPDLNGPLVGTVQHNQSLPILETRVVAGQNWYRIGAGQWVYGPSVGVARFKARPASIRSNERWVGVSLKEQTLVAYEGDKPVYAALIASGLPGTPTVQGIFRTWWRLTSRKMSGGSGSGYYYLEEVTWTCYFYGGYALHTAYWHDAFGRPRSHGCVNLSPYDAWWIFQWSAPGGANSPAVYVYWA